MHEAPSIWDIVSSLSTALAAIFTAVAATAAWLSAKAGKRAVSLSVSANVGISANTEEFSIEWVTEYYNPGCPEISPHPWLLFNEGQGVARDVKVEFRMLASVPTFQVHFKKAIASTQSFWVRVNSENFSVIPVLQENEKYKIDAPLAKMVNYKVPLTFGRPRSETLLPFPDEIKYRIISLFFLDRIWSEPLQKEGELAAFEERIVEITPSWVGLGRSIVLGNRLKVRLEHVRTQAFVDDVAVWDSELVNFMDAAAPPVIFWSRVRMQLRMVPV